MMQSSYHGDDLKTANDNNLQARLRLLMVLKMSFASYEDSLEIPKFGNSSQASAKNRSFMTKSW